MKETQENIFNAKNINAGIIAALILVLAVVPIGFRFYKNYTAMMRFEKCKENIIKIYASAKVYRLRNGNFKLNDSDYSMDYDMFSALGIDISDPYFNYFFYHKGDALSHYKIVAYAKNPEDDMFGKHKVKWITKKGQCEFEYNEITDFDKETPEPVCF